MNFPKYTATTDFERFTRQLYSRESHAQLLDEAGLQLDIAHALFHARCAAGLSRARFARKLNIQSRRLRAIEEGSESPDLAILAKSARILGKKLHIRLK